MTTTKKINKKSAKKRFSLNFFLIGIVLLLAFLQIIFANRLTTTGEILNKFENEVESLESENRKLANQIASQRSLAELRKKAEELGFKKNSSILHLFTESQVALSF